ncbi:MAG: hypothetical protein ACOCXZ_03565 [Chloroflexota bacterium]
MNSLKLFPRVVMIIGIVFFVAGLFATGAGIYTRIFVGEQLAAQNITTPDDASIPNAQVTDIATALSMADIIQEHALRITGGLTYAEMGRFAVPSGDPAGTSNAEEALLNDAGNPMPNEARNTQLTAAGLVTSLSLSALSIGISYGAIALGLAFTILGGVVAGVGYALMGLITPEVAARFGLQPIAVEAPATNEQAEDRPTSRQGQPATES